MITLARYPFDRVADVDLSGELIQTAATNMKKLRLDNVVLHRGDAAAFDLDDYDMLYLYNPFPCNVVKSVMTNLVDSIGRRPRRVTIIYNTPRCHDTVIASGSFEKVGEYPSGPSLPPFFVYSSTCAPGTETAG